MWQLAPVYRITKVICFAYDLFFEISYKEILRFWKIAHMAMDKLTFNLNIVRFLLFVFCNQKLFFETLWKQFLKKYARIPVYVEKFFRWNSQNDFYWQNIFRAHSLNKEENVYIFNCFLV